MEPDQISAALRRLEEKVDKLDDKLDEYVPKVMVLDHRVTQVEAQLKTSGDRRWLLYLAVIAAIAALLGSFVAPVVVR